MLGVGGVTLSEYLKSIRRNWAWVLILALLGGVGGYVVASMTPNTYRSSTAVLLTSDRGGSTSELVQGSTYVQNLVSSYVLLARSELVLQPVIDELGLTVSPQALAATITASSPINSVIIEINVVNRSPRLAQDIAAATTDSLTNVVTTEVAPQNDGQPTIRLTKIQSANEPKSPIAPNTRLYLLIGVLLGLVAGVALALIRTLAWHTVSSSADVATVSSAPVVGEIVNTKRDVTLPGAMLLDPLSIEAESLRSFAANLSFIRVGKGLHSLTVTSAMPAESKSSIVTGLGLALAESGRRVLLIDADLRSPSLAVLTQLDGSLGLTNVLIGELALMEAAQDWGGNSLKVLTAGSTPPNPGQLLSSDAMRALLDTAREHFDIVIIDSAPLLSVTDAKWLGKMTDGALLVVRHDKTTTRSLERVTRALDAATVPILGVVISRMPRRTRNRYGDPSYGTAAKGRFFGRRGRKQRRRNAHMAS